MRLLLTGATGMVGRAALPVLEELGVDAIATARVTTERAPIELDVRRARQVDAVLDRSRPDAVLHLAAFTDVDRCERDPAAALEARATNGDGTATLARACSERAIHLVHVSTAAVFDGRSVEGHAESDPPSPANRYAASKLLGEAAVAAMERGGTILRAGWVFGSVECGRFFTGVYRQLAAGSRELRVVEDRIGTVTCAAELTRAAVALVQRGEKGLFHLVQGGPCSRLELVDHILATLERGDVTVRPVPASAFPEDAPRPRHEVLRTEHLDHPVLGALRPWREALSAHVTRDWTAARR